MTILHHNCMQKGIKKIIIIMSFSLAQKGTEKIITILHVLHVPNGKVGDINGLYKLSSSRCEI